MEVSKSKIKKVEKFISLSEASKLCDYSQEYLSLRSRQKKLKSKKIGRNWFTTEQWLNEYLKENGKNEECPLQKRANSQPASKKEISKKNFLFKSFNFATSLIASVISSPFVFVGAAVDAVAREIIFFSRNVFKFFIILFEVLLEIFIPLARRVRGIFLIFFFRVKNNFKFFFSKFKNGSLNHLYGFFSFFYGIIRDIYFANRKHYLITLNFFAKIKFNSWQFLKLFCVKIKRKLEWTSELRFIRLAAVLSLTLFVIFLFQNGQFAKAEFFKFANDFGYAQSKIVGVAREAVQRLIQKNNSLKELTSNKYLIFKNRSFLLKTEFLAETKDFSSEIKKSFQNAELGLKRKAEALAAGRSKALFFAVGGLNKFLKKTETGFSRSAEFTASVIDVVKRQAAFIKRKSAKIAGYAGSKLQTLSSKLLFLRDKLTGIEKIKEDLSRREKKDEEVFGKEIPVFKKREIIRKETIVKEKIANLSEIYSELYQIKSKNLVIEGILSSQPKYFDSLLSKVELLTSKNLTSKELDSKLNQLNNKLTFQIIELKNQLADRIQTRYRQNFQAIAYTNKIDQLINATLTAPSISAPTITGNASFETLSTSGSVTIGKDLTAYGNLIISGNQTFAGDQSVAGALTVSATTTLSSDLRADIDTLVVDALNNRVGVGTTSPQYTLDVDGTLRASSIITAGQTIGGDFSITGSTTLGDATSTDIIYVNSRIAGSLIPTADNILDLGEAITPLRWRSGYFGTSLAIGGIATSTPSQLTISGAYLLDADGTLSLNTANNQPIVTGTGLFTIGGSASTTGSMTLGSSVSDLVFLNAGLIQYLNYATTTIQNNLINAFSIATSSSGVPIFSIDTSSGQVGRIGIGTTSPSEQLSVANRLYVGGTGTSTIENNLLVQGTIQANRVFFP
jgi:hypothetical protein